MTFDPKLMEYEQANFDGDDFSDLTLDGYRFTGCSFKGAKFSTVETHACTFVDCNFEYAHLNGSLHRASAFISCRFGGASLFGAEMIGCKGTASSFIKANTAGVISAMRCFPGRSLKRTT